MAVCPGLWAALWPKQEISHLLSGLHRNWIGQHSTKYEIQDIQVPAAASLRTGRELLNQGYSMEYLYDKPLAALLAPVLELFTPKLRFNLRHLDSTSIGTWPRSRWWGSPLRHPIPSLSLICSWPGTSTCSRRYGLQGLLSRPSAEGGSLAAL